MITSISIKNFRSIEAAELALGPIAVLYGPTSSGKSSLLYSALVLRNFLLNPNRQADGYFHLGFMDLGGFDACVFNHDPSRELSIAITHDSDDATSSYALALSKTTGSIRLESGQLKMQAKVSIPYALNQSFAFPHTEESEEYTINWNGIACTAVPKKPTADSQQKAQVVAARLNASAEVVKAIDIAPHNRGFFKPNYTPVGISPTPTTEDEVASIIINDPNLRGRISVYTEEIFGRDFWWHVSPGTATAFFHTTDKKSRMPVFLVNDGFGVNQVIYMLAKMHRVDVRTILIEEPEVHLHPTVLRNFARALCSFVKDEGKQIILATHSELFLTSMLTAVSDGSFSANDLKCYLATKDRKSTAFKAQTVKETGQIEGGLSSFVEAEYEDLRKLLGVK
jgi:hypothetical protein